jgi:hypothetical protein
MIVQLQAKLTTFVFTQKKQADELWILSFGYLSDIFSKMNESRLSLQGKHQKIFITDVKI